MKLRPRCKENEGYCWGPYRSLLMSISLVIAIWRIEFHFGKNPCMPSDKGEILGNMLDMLSWSMGEGGLLRAVLTLGIIGSTRDDNGDIRKKLVNQNGRIEFS